MLTQDDAQKLIEIGIKHGTRKKVDAIEAMVSASDVATSRFANNGMTQNQAPQHVSISVRVQLDGKQARLSSDKVSPSDIRALVEDAIKVAEYLEPEEDMLPMPQPQKKSQQKNVNRFDAKTANFTAKQRADAIKTMIDIAERDGLIAAGTFATGSWAHAIGNSNGLFRFHRETTAESSITMKHVDAVTGSESTGWAKHESVRVADVDPRVLAERASRKAIASSNPQEVKPGKYTVILEPSAVLDLICGYLPGDFTGTSFVDKLSCFLGKVGQSVVGENITILDDVYHPLQSGPPFDGEGMQRGKLTLINRGKLEQLVYGRRSALTLETKPTGHGLVEPNSEGEHPENIVIEGGNQSLEEMIASTERGILLTRVWYVREVDPTLKIVTGMTRDGTFLIENGAIKCGVKNMRFNESILGLLSNVVALGPAERTAGEEAEPGVAPAMKVSGFNFSSITTF